MPAKIRIICFGLGPIGAAIAKLALERKDQVEVIGAVDVNPELRGKDLGRVVGTEGPAGIAVSASGRDLYSGADVVLHATGSYLAGTMPQFKEICGAGLDVVSTTEELAFPWFAHAEEAAELDELARRNGVTVLGLGVNPGFVLDCLAITLSGACSKIRYVRGTRVLDAAKRRLPFQRKVGVGLSVEDFRRRVESGAFGHVGLRESIDMVASAIGCRIDRFEQAIAPRIAERPLEVEGYGRIEPGQVLGLAQDGRGILADGRNAIDYHIEMYAGAEDPHDAIEISGQPDLKLIIPGGTPGDAATAALVVNSVRRVLDSPPGLKTVRDLRPASGVFVSGP